MVHCSKLTRRFTSNSAFLSCTQIAEHVSLVNNACLSATQHKATCVLRMALCKKHSVSNFERVSVRIQLSDGHQELSKGFCNLVRNQNSEQYPPKTIQHYLLVIQRYI